ncbi:MAG: bile acid-coenzyme A ligase [Candidatus Promineifilaceae bacterium]|jgi:bile acid-coenzyme A ligase
MTEQISFGRRAQQWADKHPDKAAIIFYPADTQQAQEFSWRTVVERSNQIARLLAQHGVDENSSVVIGLPNCPEHYLVSLAIWKLGALAIPLRSKQPRHERDQILELATPKVVVADWDEPDYTVLNLGDLQQANHLSAEPLPDIIAQPGKAIASGGSTGRSKLIVAPAPWVGEEESPIWEYMGFRPQMIHLMCGPLYHNAPYLFSHRGFFQGHTLILMERFDAAKAVDLIERHKVSFAYMAPIMMSRIAKLPGVEQRNLRSMRTLLHTAAPCPPWLKHAWINLIGGENLLELFAATEAVGIVTIRGDEWLEHEGSVGRPVPGCEMRILDPHGNECPTGDVGEIFMRWTDPDREPSYSYIGSDPAKSGGDGFSSVGDLGWVDEDGYLFVADRRVDMIISGGANVFPAEVEAVLTEHEAIADVAVIGLLDEEWGKRVHAVVQFKDGVEQPDASALNSYCRDRLMVYKVPKSYDFVERLPRNSAGKLRRTALVGDRQAGDSVELIWV